MKTLLGYILAFVTVIAGATPIGSLLAQGPLPPVLGEAAPVHPDSEVLSLGMLAEKALLEGRFQESVQLYSRGVGMAPNRSSLYLGRAMALEMLNRTKNAAEDYERVLKHDPDNYQAMEGLAGILEREGKDIERAIALYEQALDSDPRAEWKENLVVWIKMLQSRLRSDDASPIALWKQGNGKARDGKAADAEALYAKAIGLDPLFYQAYYRRGLVRAARGDLKGALEDLDAAVGFSPELRGALIQRGLIHKRLRNEEQAMEDFRRASEVDSRDPIAHCHLGRLCEEHGLYTEAMASYERALKLNPKPDIRNWLQQRMIAVRDPAKSASHQRSNSRKTLKELW